MTKTKETINHRGRRITRFAARSQFLSRPYNPHYANDNTALRPEVWANESIRLLYEMMQWGGVVHRDFDPEIAKFGEVVHTNFPGTLKAKRKQNDLDTLETQDVTATDLEVRLNQRIYVSFLLGDGDRSKSFKNLFEYHMVPQMEGQTRLMDRILAGQVYQFLDNQAGGLGQMSASTASDYMLDARQEMNDNFVPDEGRWLGLASPTETAMQKVDLFKSAERVGDGGRALRNALLGRKHGFNTFLSLNTPSVRGATKTAATTTTATAAAGDLIINATAVTNLNPGQYYTVVGDYTPLRVASVNTLAVTNTRPLLRAVGNGAAIQPYALGAINQTGAIAAGDTTAGVANGYPSGWMKHMAVDGTGVPKVGQLVAFRAAGSTVHAAEYCIVDVDGATILLDRPLENTVADGDVVCYGPDGDYNFFLQRAALTLVNRPMELPPTGAGARSARGTYNHMSLRTVITYDGATQATRVTVDCLLGVKKLQTARGGVLLG